MYKSKNAVLSRLDALAFILGSDTIEKELVHFLSLDDLNLFVAHIERMHDVDEYEHLLEKYYYGATEDGRD